MKCKIYLIVLILDFLNTIFNLSLLKTKSFIWMFIISELTDCQWTCVCKSETFSIKINYHQYIIKIHIITHNTKFYLKVDFYSRTCDKWNIVWGSTIFQYLKLFKLPLIEESPIKKCPTKHKAQLILMLMDIIYCNAHAGPEAGWPRQSCFKSNKIRYITVSSYVGLFSRNVIFP